MATEIHGFCEDRFLPLKEAFEANFEAGLELGSSLAATHEGRTAVDLWAGWANPEETRPWGRDTIVNVASTTKIMTALCALMVVDRGLLDLDAPIARYWPEFGAGCKAGVTVRDAFTHHAGVPGLEPPPPAEAMEDWDGITARIAAEPHWFDGRRQIIYHLITYGFILGELIRRVDGRRPARFFAEEIAQKAGVDFQIGLASRSDLPRVADIHRHSPGPMPPAGSLLARLMLAQSLPPPGPPSWERRSADIPAGNGYGNGRSIARACAIVAMGGELDGVRYLSPAIVAQMAREQATGEDPFFGGIRWGLGFALDSEWFAAPSATSLHWGGRGGSLGLVDPAQRFSLGYAPNNAIDASELDMDPRDKPFWGALETILPRL